MNTTNPGKPVTHTHNAWWQEDQVVIIYESREPVSTIADGIIISRKESIVKSLEKPVSDLNGFLSNKGFSISPIMVENTARSPLNVQVNQNPELIGKYLFTTMTAEREALTTIICFFRFMDQNLPQMTSGGALASRMQGNAQNEGVKGNTQDGDAGDSQHVNSSGRTTPKGSVPRIVDTINENLQLLQTERYTNDIRLIAACPSWYCGATTNGDPGPGDPPKPTGCPQMPPFPLPGHLSCQDTPGLWPITFPTLSAEMQDLTGDGVSVFVLDTMPKTGDLARAAEAAGEHNVLLLDVVNNVTHNYQLLPDSLDIPSIRQPATGKDIDGNLIGFRVPDHGLSVAGIIRDIAPSTQVECIRVLNDMCVGDMTTVTKALEYIANRMSMLNPDTQRRGDLYQKPVVINLSMVISPSDEDITNQQIDSALDLIRTNLLIPIKSLLQLGAVVVASAGNEADIHTDSGPSGSVAERPEALYPAAFAYDSVMINALAPNPVEILPVGAIDSKGNVTSYSCYPGPKGLATYGGAVPKKAATPSSNGMTQVTDIDAVIGLYSDMWYAALSHADPHPRYSAPNAHGWAYWVGTSFATPIITGLTARVMEAQLRGQIAQGTSVCHCMLHDVASANTIWSQVPSTVSAEGNILGKMIMAVQQCSSGTVEGQGQTQSKKDEDEGEGSVHIKISYERE